MSLPEPLPDPIVCPPSDPIGFMLPSSFVAPFGENEHAITESHITTAGLGRMQPTLSPAINATRRFSLGHDDLTQR
jgi:hypothetical protein